MRLFQRKATKEEHDRVERIQANQTKKLQDHAARLKELEIEVGIYKPLLELREANGP